MITSDVLETNSLVRLARGQEGQASLSSQLVQLVQLPQQELQEQRQRQVQQQVDRLPFPQEYPEGTVVISILSKTCESTNRHEILNSTIWVVVASS